MLTHTTPRSGQSNSAQSFALASQGARYMIAELTSEGNLLCDQENPQEALNCFLEAMEMLNNSQSVEDNEIAICHYNTARAYAMLNMSDEALEHYSNALQANPKLLQAHNNIGMLLNQNGYFDEASEHFKQAIELDGSFAPAYYGLGVALQSTGDNLNAGIAYKKALTLNPESYAAWLNLGLVCYAIESYEIAINCYQEAITLSNQDAEAFYKLGLAYMATSNLKQAVIALNRALELSPDYEAAQDAYQYAVYFLPKAGS